MSGMSLQASDAADFEAVFSLIASSKSSRLKVQCPESLFLDGKGTVVAHFKPNKGSLFRTADKNVSQGSLDKFAESCRKAVPDGAGEGTPVAIARFREYNQLLTASELLELLVSVNETASGALGPGADGPVPFVLQKFVRARGDLRFVTTYMWADTDIVCESFQSRFSGAYAHVPDATNGFANGGGGGTRPSTVGGEGGEGPGALWSGERPESIARPTLLELRQSTLGVVNYINKVHEIQAVGLVLEHVVDEAGQLWLLAVLGTCWSEYWYRHRAKNADGRLFCSHPDLQSAEGRPRTGRHTPGAMTYAHPTPYKSKARRELLPLATAPTTLGSTFNGSLGFTPGGDFEEELHGEIHGTDPSEVGSPTPALTPRPPPGSAKGSPADAGAASARRKLPKYGLESEVAAAIISPRFAPRMSERGVWAGPRDSPVREALRASAAALVSTGKAPAKSSTGYSQRGRCNPPLVVQLTRRLEEVRESLQVQAHRSAASELAELRWREGKQRADGERDRVTAALGEADRRYAADLLAWRAEEERLLQWGTDANNESAERLGRIEALEEERGALKARMDYERECAVDISGDLKKRLDATRAELETLQAESDATLRAAEGDKTILEASLAEERKRSTAMSEHLKEQQEYARDLENQLRELRVALAAISAERDNLLRAMPNVSVDSRQHSGGNLIAPEEIDDLLSKEENQAAEITIINRVLKESSVLLRQIFRYYATLRDRGHDRIAVLAAKEESMGMGEFSKFCKDCKLIDRVTIDNIKVDQIFVKVNFNAKAALAGDRMIEFDEFSEALVRLAVARYKSLPHVSDKLQRILEADVFPLAKRTTVLIETKKKKKARGAPRCAPRPALSTGDVAKRPAAGGASNFAGAFSGADALGLDRAMGSPGGGSSVGGSRPGTATKRPPVSAI